jgi:hypothetical protein
VGLNNSGRGSSDDFFFCGNDDELSGSAKA